MQLSFGISNGYLNYVWQRQSNIKGRLYLSNMILNCFCSRSLKW